MYLALRTKRALAGFPRTEDPREILIELLTAGAVMFSNVPEDQCLRLFRDCLRFVRGDAEAEQPKPPDTLN